MQVMNQNQDGRNRKAYSKPEVRRVELKPEESLAAGCKTAAATNSAILQTDQPCNVGSCFDIGS
jgi:hypothetical protein